MAFATGFFGITATAVSEKRPRRDPAQELTSVSHPQHLVMSLIPTVVAVLHNPPGATIYLSPGPPFPTDGAVSFAILYFQIAVTDVVVVLPPHTTPLPVVTDDTPTGLPNVPHLR